MQTTGTTERSGSPAPGIIPDPAYVHWERDPVHRGRAGIGLAKLLRVIRGDKYMTNAYPPEWQRHAQ
jgi:hypothetical protein